jgi:hypothetical protein
MPYTPTTWVSGTTAVSATNMNNLEQQFTEAVNSVHQDMLTGFVETGSVPTKNGTTATQLDVPAITAWVVQGDGVSVRRRAPSATNFSTTGHPSTTMFLDLKSDGTYNWATSHTGSNYLTICSVLTDASSNISSVTDTRQLNTNVFANMAGTFINIPERGPNNTVTSFTLSARTSTPSSLAAGEICFVLS